MTRGMMSEMCSGSDTREQSVSRSGESNRDTDKNLRDATLRMWQNVKAVPSDIRNIVYRFTCNEGRYRESLQGPWPRVARALAKSGSPEADVMAPAYEVRNQLRREVYRKNIPSLAMVEELEADVVCRIQKAEISHSLPELREAAREEVIIAELLEEAADREAHKEQR